MLCFEKNCLYVKKPDFQKRKKNFFETRNLSKSKHSLTTRKNHGEICKFHVIRVTPYHLCSQSHTSLPYLAEGEELPCSKL